MNFVQVTKLIMQVLICFPVLCMLVFSGYSQTITYFETGEEFVGPFPSWKNIKTDFGAKGDGSTDDATVINQALAAAGLKAGNTVATGFNVIYFPAGTYRITQPIKNIGRVNGDDFSGMTLIGEDPANTVIKWDGATYTNSWKVDAAWATGPMAVFDGWNFKLSRLTFDGNNKARIGVMRDGSFSTYSEFSDVYIKNVRIGLQLCGTTEFGQAEDAILRCRFSNCSDVAIWGPNMNTMDEYIWHCLFEDCGTGISSGGWHPVGCVFLRSKVIDMTDTWNPVCVLNNISVGSNKFIYVPGNTGSSILMGNQVFQCDSANPTTWDITHFTMIDNTFDMGTTMRCIGNHLLSVNNTFTRSNPLTLEQNSISIPFVNIGQKIVTPASLQAPTTISLPGPPKKSTRQIFEVRKATGNDATEIQAQIIAAAGVTPVGIVHIPTGTYAISKTVIIPAGKDVIVVGDAASEYGTRLNWSATASGLMFKLLGPANRATMRDLMLLGTSYGGSDVVSVEKSDQVGGRIYCEQVLAGGNGDIKANRGFFIDGVENSDVLMFDGAAFTINPDGGSGVLIKGGQSRAAGLDTAKGQATFLFGGLGQTVNLFNVVNGGQLVALGARDEVPYEGSLINLTSASSGKLTIGGMSFAILGSNSVPSFAVNGFNGTFTNIGNTCGRGYGGSAAIYFGISGDGTNTRVLNIDSYPTDWRDVSSPAAKAHYLPCGTGTTGPLQNIINKATSPTVDTAFILSSLVQLRSMRLDAPVAKPAGVTDVKLLRVRAWAGTGKTAVTVKGDTGTAVFDIQQSDPRSQFRVMQKVGIGNNSFAIQPFVKSIAVYDALGRMVWSRALTRTGEMHRAEQDIRAMSDRGIVFVRTAR